MTQAEKKKSTIQTSTKTASRTQRDAKTQANGLSVHTGTRAGSPNSNPDAVLWFDTE